MVALLVLLCRGVSAAQDPKREPFALFPVARKADLDAKEYHYKRAISRVDESDLISGWYRPSIVLNTSHIADIREDTQEMASAPFSGLSFAFTEEGFKTLRDYLQSPKAGELLAMIDGHAYATISLETLRGIIDRRSRLFIVFPDQGPVASHLIQLLLEKFPIRARSVR